MGEQEVKVSDGGDEPVWITVSEYLKRHIANMVPMSVGRCVRFCMRGAIDVRPKITAEQAWRNAGITNEATAYNDAKEGIILILPDAVQVDVTFDGDHIIKAAGLG